MEPNKNGILLFGGTFDPIHNGHLQICRAAAELLAIEKVILIPSAIPPHKTDCNITPIEHRLAMAQAAVQHDAFFEVSDCELQRKGPSYTLDTVHHFQQLYGPTVKIHWLIGADMLREIATWYEISQLVEKCQIVTAVRPGHDLSHWQPKGNLLTPQQIQRLKSAILPTPLLDISATDIRNRAATGKPITNLVPDAVAEYIAAHNLYRFA
ncbi:MAG: nicotinate (nicotinamide) nucleotide adenylyltransferase [Sedimentisphaerales bacterium]|nr:nicotinate (nicotinamide) nucleotide adenylyltransferase [Sedimentisphaerales bacterium]